MVDGQVDVVSTEAVAAACRRSPWRWFGWCFVRTWLMVAFGGALCGPLAVNVASVQGLPITAAVGLVLGLTYGLLLVVPLSWWLIRQRPGRAPRSFVRTLQVIGASVAVLVNGSTNVSYALWRVRPYPEAPLDPLPTVGWLALAGAFTVASGFVGWMCGAILAQRVLVEIDPAAAAAARRPMRRRRPWR